MNYKEFGIGVVMLEDTYDGFRITSNNRKMDIWFEMLRDLTKEEFISCIKKHIALVKFTPSVASLREMKTVTAMTEVEAWAIMSKALSNSAYNARQEWEKLPEAIKQVITPELMREWATLECDDVQTVIQSNFMRSFKEKKIQIKQTEMIGDTSSGDIRRLSAGILKVVK